MHAEFGKGMRLSAAMGVELKRLPFEVTSWPLQVTRGSCCGVLLCATIQLNWPLKTNELALVAPRESDKFNLFCVLGQNRSLRE